MPKKPLRHEDARLVVAVRQLDDRRVLPHRDRLRRRHHILDAPAELAGPGGGRIGDEGRGHFDLGVLRERLGVGQIHRAARAIEAVGGGAQPAGDVGGVAHEEVAEVDEHAAARFGDGREAPDHRLGERLFHGLPLVGVRTDGAVVVVGLDHQDLRADALEADDACAGQLRAIQPDVVRSHAGPKARHVEHLRVQSRNLEVERAGAGLLPVEREEPVELLRAVRAVGDRRQPASPLRARLRLALVSRHDGVTGSQHEQTRHDHDERHWRIGSSCKLRGADLIGSQKLKPTGYSALRAISGSIDVALRAGPMAATSAATRNTPATAAYAVTSVVCVANSSGGSAG